MNAQEAATVAGMHKTRGEIPMLSAVAARMGRDMAVDARFEANSVRQTMAKTMMTTKTGSGRQESPPSRSTTH